MQLHISTYESMMNDDVVKKNKINNLIRSQPHTYET